jgi:D-glycero-D-manno-heptose 1,7-bisphosphate phosphatase
VILVPPIVHPVPGKTLLLFDADGTLRRCTVPGQPCPNKPGEWELLPNVRETLAVYNWQTTWCAVISNQGGIGLGYLEEAMAMFLLQETLTVATGHPVLPHQVWLCPHAPQAGCACRKPAPLLLERAQLSMHNQGWPHGHQHVLYIGDQESDRDAAERAAIDFCYAHVFFGWEAPK